VKEQVEVVEKSRKTKNSTSLTVNNVLLSTTLLALIMVLLFFGSCSCEEIKLNIPEWVTNALFDSKDIGKNYEKNASIVVSGDFKLCKGAKGVYPNINLYNLISINMISYNFTI